MIRQAFREESMSHTRVFDILCSGQTEKGKTGEEQSQEHAHNFDILGIDYSHRICHVRLKSQSHILL
jgi:hypothetical protein